MLQKQPGNVCILFAENISSMSIKLELGKKNWVHSNPDIQPQILQ
jgi:hypothetical protein